MFLPPIMDGYKVCSLLKHDTRFAKIPIILFTARAQETDEKLGLECGADAYLTKPRPDGSGRDDQAATAPIAHRANRTVPADRAPNRRLSNWQCRETKRPTAARPTGNRRRADRTVPDEQAADRRLSNRRSTNTPFDPETLLTKVHELIRK